MRIFKLKKNWTAYLPMLTTYKEGKRFFERSDEYVGKIYDPENNSYPVWGREDFKFVDEYFEFVGETEKDKSYFTDKIYTQEQVDKLLK